MLHIKISKSIIIIIIAIFLVLSVVIAFVGKPAAIRYMEELTGTKVTFEAVHLGFPLTIDVYKFKAQDLLEVEKARLSLSLLRLITGKLYFNKVILESPLAYIERSRNGELNITPIIERQVVKEEKIVVPASSEPIKEEQKSQKQPFKQEIVFNEFIIKNGHIRLIDKAVQSQGLTTDINNLELKLAHFKNPPLKSEFNLTANVSGRPDQAVGEVKFDGFIDMIKKDMSAELVIKNLDGVFFQPYFQMFLPADLESAKVNFNLMTEAKANKLFGKGKLVVENFALKNQESTDKENLNGPLAGVIMLGMVNHDKRGEVDFVMAETALDNPKFRIKNIDANIVQSAAQNFMNDPKGTIEKAKEIGKEIKSIGDIFKKKSE